MNIPETTPEAPRKPEQPYDLSNIKIYFLYLLIGSLVVSAIISVIALLIGSFNETLGRALGTTLLFVVHSAVVLSFVLVDRRNHLGKSLLVSTILGSVLLSLAVSTLGIWEIIGGDTAWRLYGILSLFIGAAFILTGIQQFKLRHKPVTILAYATFGLTLLFALLVAPWILFAGTDALTLPAYYYRIIGAVTILGVTAFIVLAVLNRMALHQHAERKLPSPTPYPAGLLSIIISIGVVISMIWLVGAAALVDSAYDQNREETLPGTSEFDNRYTPHDSYYEDSYDYDD